MYLCFLSTVLFSSVHCKLLFFISLYLSLYLYTTVLALLSSPLLSSPLLSSPPLSSPLLSSHSPLTLLSLSSPLTLALTLLSPLLSSHSPLTLLPISLHGSALYIARALIFAIGIVAKLDSAHFSLVAVGFLHPLGAAASEGIAVFLTRDNVGSAAIRRTLWFMCGWALLIGTFGIISWSFDHDVGATENFVPEGAQWFWICIDVLRSTFYIVILVFAFRTQKSTGRSSAFMFVALELSAYVFSTLFDSLLYVETDPSACGLFWTWTIWTFTWPYVLYRCLAIDSSFWANIGKKPKIPRIQIIDEVVDNRDMHSPLLPLHDDYKSSPYDSEFVTQPDFSLEYENLDILQQIAEGGTAAVHIGTYNGRAVAVKVFKCEMLTPKYISRFAQEAAFSHRLQHECIVESIGVCVVPPSICLVQEFMEGGSLFHVLKKYPHLSVRRRLRMARDIARGVAFLHSQSPPVLHRDLKSLNVLINRSWDAKLADLGEAKEYSAEFMTSQRGTPHWMAPEVFQSSTYTVKADVYSLGILLWEIATQLRPFDGMNPWLIPAAVCENNVRPQFTGDAYQKLPGAYIELVHECWDTDDTARPPAFQVAHRLTQLLADVEAQYDMSVGNSTHGSGHDSSVGVGVGDRLEIPRQKSSAMHNSV
jgi:Protein kinase domain